MYRRLCYIVYYTLQFCLMVHINTTYCIIDGSAFSQWLIKLSIQDTHSTPCQTELFVIISLEWLTHFSDVYH